MRILMLSNEYPPNVVGGLGKHVEALVPALAACDVEVHLVTQRDREGAPKEVIAPNLTVYRVDVPPGNVGAPLSDTQAANWELAQFSDMLGPQVGGFDLIHVHDWLVAFAGIRLKHLWRIPLLATIHASERGRHQGELYTELSRAINEVEDELCMEAWRVIVTSYYMAHEIVAYFGEPYDKIDVVPNAVSVAAFDAYDGNDLRAFRRRYVADDEFLVFHVGRIVYEKGLHILVEAAPAILAQMPGVKFVIAGKGPMVDELRLQARRLGVGDQFYFTGFIDDLERDRLYKVADVAVFPSLYEPFGIVALEAMAARVPVVVSGVGGLMEVVENHVTGITALPGHAGSLAWSILHTLAHPEWSSARVENAYRRVIEHFSWEAVASQTREIYARVIEERHHTQW